METKILIDFPASSPHEANLLAADLHDYLNRNVLGDSEIVKDRKDTMDFGATLAIILGASTTLAIAKGIAAWLQKQQSRTITIKLPGGEIVGSNLGSKDIAAILEKIKIL